MASTVKPRSHKSQGCLGMWTCCSSSMTLIFKAAHHWSNYSMNILLIYLRSEVCMFCLATNHKFQLQPPFRMQLQQKYSSLQVFNKKLRKLEGRYCPTGLVTDITLKPKPIVAFGNGAMGDVILIPWIKNTSSRKRWINQHLWEKTRHLDAGFNIHVR